MKNQIFESKNESKIPVGKESKIQFRNQFKLTVLRVLNFQLVCTKKIYFLVPLYTRVKFQFNWLQNLFFFMIFFSCFNPKLVMVSNTNFESNNESVLEELELKEFD